MYITFFIYISAVKFNALMQIHFNGTNFFNARLTQRLFSVWPVAQPIVGEMEMQCCQLSNIADPFSDFFPFKKAPKPSFWESPVLLCASARSCSPARAHTSLSLCLLSFYSAIGREEQRFNSVKHRFYVASLILHASIAEILCRLHLGRESFLCSLVLMGRVSVTISYSFRCLTTETVKYTNENRFIENLASSKYSMWVERETNVIINNKCTFCIFRRRAALCAKM